MLPLSRARLVPALALVAAGLLLPTAAARGQAANKPKTKSVQFETHDRMKLSGTLYPKPAADVVVLLLHDFDLKKGGGSQQEGWTNLAKSLQSDGYAVFMFDFRGFGDSKTIEDKNTFWAAPYNNVANIKRTALRKETLDHKDFNPGYLPYLVNDIAAAKAYLDRANDRKELNTANLVVIGAGEGATLGAMWLANEARRRKDKLGGLPGRPPAQTGDPEVRDAAAAIWLTISPKVGSRTPPLSRWVAEAGKDHKVPTLFVFGKNDGRGDTLSMTLFRAINPKGAKTKDFPNTGRMPVADSKLTGEKLLDKDTIKELRTYIGKVMEDRSVREWFKREVEDSRYVYMRKAARNYVYARDNKQAKVDKVPGVDVNFLLGP